MRWRFLFLSRNSSDAATAAHSLHEEADDDIIYLEDLVGFRATFDGHPLRGEITDYIDSEQNPLFAITAEGREILVPAAEEMISALDIDAREITFVLPEGLLDLYL